MARNGDKSVTWQQVTTVVVMAVALGGSILKMSDVAGESKDAIVQVEKAQEAQHKIHDDDQFAHEPMRKMVREELKAELKPHTDALKALIVAIEKITP